jgi:hypothetical protein
LDSLFALSLDSAKSAEQIISRDKIIAIWESKSEFEPYKICFGDFGTHLVKGAVVLSEAKDLCIAAVNRAKI